VLGGSIQHGSFDQQACKDLNSAEDERMLNYFMCTETAFGMAAGCTLLDSSSISTRLVMVDMKAGSVPVSCTGTACVRMNTGKTDEKNDIAITMTVTK